MNNDYQVKMLLERVDSLTAHVRAARNYQDRQFAAGKAEGIIEALYHLNEIGDMDFHALNRELTNALYR